LITVTIPNSVTSIDTNAFTGNDKLVAINVSSGNTKYSSQDGVLYSKDKKEIIYWPEGKRNNITIPSTVTTIGDNAFAGDYWYGGNITSITIPNSVVDIGHEAFIYNKLTSVTIPNSVKSIGAYAFNKNPLISITIGANVSVNSGNLFAEAYYKNGRQAGTYTRSDVNSNVWTKQSSPSPSSDITPDPAAAKEYFNKGKTLTVKNEWESAIREYTEAIKYDPNYASAYINRGCSYVEIRNYDSAIADFNEAIRINPKDASAYVNRGSAYYYKGNYDQALKDFNEAIKLEPEKGSRYYNRGLAYKKKGNQQMADADFAKARELGYKF